MLYRDCSNISRNFRIICENTIRGLLVVFTVVVATQLPYFGAVLSSVGGFTDALQAFVIPSLIGLQVIQGKVPWEGYFHRFVAGLGVLIMLHTVIQLMKHVR